MEIIRFDADDIDNQLARMSPEELDALAFGAIQLDRHGTILQYSAVEGAITGRDPGDVVGLNFFRDVAPCTDTPAFYGKFAEGTRTGELDISFEYTFDYRMRPTKVKVRMKRASMDDSYWVFVKRL